MNYKYLPLLAVVATLGACDSDPSGPSDPTPRVTLDASASTSFALLGTPPTTATGIGDPSTSTGWDLAFNATTVLANGGASGPGGVSVYCLCQNASKTDAQIVAQTTQDGIDAFNAVTAANIPGDASLFKTDAVRRAIDSWYDYNPVSHVVTVNPTKFWGLRLNTISGGRAKLRFTSLAGTGAPPAPMIVGIEWVVASSGAAGFGATQTLAVTSSPAAKAYLNLSTGAIATGTAPAEWDISFSGDVVNLNPAGSVAGAEMTAGDPTLTFASLTAVDLHDMPTSAFSKDGSGGIFVTAPWYRYDINPAVPHQITPTFDVYLVKKGADVYKVQIASYYHPRTGDSRHITLRAAKLD